MAVARPATAEGSSGNSREHGHREAPAQRARVVDLVDGGTTERVPECAAQATGPGKPIAGPESAVTGPGEIGRWRST